MKRPISTSSLFASQRYAYTSTRLSVPRTPGSFWISSLTLRSVASRGSREDVVRLHRDHEDVVVAEVEDRALVDRLAGIVLGQERLARGVDADAEAERRAAGS